MSTVKSKGQNDKLFHALQDIFPNHPLTVAELKQPTRDFVVGFYLEFLSNIGMNTAVICEVPPAMYEKFGDTYLYRKLFLVLREVFNKILLSEPISPFNMLDLLQPSHGRTAAFFMAMCNFTSFCAAKLADIDQYIDDLQSEKEEFDMLIQKREAFRQKLNEEAQTRARISDLETKVTQKQQELRKLAEDGNAAEKLVVEKENILKDMEEKLQQLNKEFFELEQERANAEALVVRSPMSVKNQKSLLEQKLKEADEKTDAAKDMLTSKRDISKKLETLGEELESRTNLLKKIISESKEISKDKEVTEELRRKWSKIREELDECYAERQKLRERELHLQETESGMLLRCETKKKEYQAMLKSMRRDLDEVIKQTGEEKMAIQNAIDKSYGEISRLVNSYSALCKKCEDLYAALLLKEKSIGDKTIEDLQEIIAKFQK